MIVSRMLEKMANTGQVFMEELEELELVDEGLVFKDSGEVVEMDEVGLTLLGKYLGINKSYLLKCPPQLQQENVNYWLNKNPNSVARLKVSNGLLVQVSGIEDKVIHNEGFLQHFTSPFLKKDKVTHFDISDTGRLEVDIVHKHSEYELEGHLLVGGVRGTSHPGNEDGAPRLTPILYHEESEATLAFPSSLTRISFRRRSTSELLQEVEEVVGGILEGGALDEIYNYAVEHPTPITEDVSIFLGTLGEQRELSQKVSQALKEEVSEKEPNTLLELSLLTASFANGSLSHNSKLILQGMAGDMLLTPSLLTQRCNKCGSVVVE